MLLGLGVVRVNAPLDTVSAPPSPVTWRAGADLLVTYDKGILSKSIVPTVTPKDAIAWLEAL